MNTSASHLASSSPNALLPPMISFLNFGQGERNIEIARHWVARSGIVADLATPNGPSLRRARLHISFGCLTQALALWGARFWEEDAPTGVLPVEWILISRTPITSVPDVLQLLKETHGLVTQFSCH